MASHSSEKAVVLLSGGLDSTIVAAHAKKEYGRQWFLFCDYGQKTLARELFAFDALCDRLQPSGTKKLDMTWLRDIAGSTSALFDPRQMLVRENRKSEYVPFRNAALLSAGVALAETVEADTVMIGSTGSDRTCPDNSPEFIKAYQAVVAAGTMTARPISIEAPLMSFASKVEVITYGLTIDAPLELSWSCHNNLGAAACGACSNCEARRGAFDELGVSDPIPYESAGAGAYDQF
jgi:7-cyano-7-deazaguanine synthase